MDTEERLKWLETRIASSLRPRADELKLVFSRDESRATLIEFFSNDEARRLFVFNKFDDRGGNLKVSLHAPKQNIEKCICFVKAGTASQLHAGNFDDAITCLDWSDVLPHARMFVRDIYLPLLCTDTDLVNDADGLIISPDKLMDILHRLLGNFEVSMGVSEGKVSLPLPCIEVLAEAAAFQGRQPAVVHVLESAVVGWIRQIRSLLHHDALAATKKISVEMGEAVRPHHEFEMWNTYIQHTTSLLEQLKAPVASDILLNLGHAGSTYAQSFGEVHAEIESALEGAKARLRCFATVLPWIQDMYRISSLDKTLKVFPPLLQTVLLIWKNSDYYHDRKPFAHLLNMLSNEVVACAQGMVGRNPFKDTQHSYTALKDALRLCAAFRGTYIDFKEAANEFNAMKVESTVITMSRLRPKDKNVLFPTKVYGPAGYHQWASRVQQADDPNDEDEQWIDSPWPQRNHRCFSGLSRFVERCNDLLDLVETTRHFQILQEAAQVGGAGSRALDALITDIHQVFMRTIRDFTSHHRDVLTIDEKQHFEAAFFKYRSVIKTLERRLAGVLRTALRICPNAMSHLRVLEVFEGVSARELLQRELQADNNQLIHSLTEEFKSVKKMFQAYSHNVPNHVNMPPTVSKLIWIRGLKERVGMPMSKVRKACPHALESDVGWQLRDSYSDVMGDLEKFETRLLHQWSNSISHDLRDRLKQAVLGMEELESAREHSDSRLWRRNSSRASTSVDDQPAELVSGLKVNLDAKLVEMLRDVFHLQRPPHDVPIPGPVRALLRCTSSSALQSQATRIKTIVSKHNHIVQRMQEYEEMLFENKMRRVQELINEGTELVTWGSADLEDFIQKSSSVICDDVYAILTRIHSNWDKVKEMSRSWSEGELDIFTTFLVEQETKSLKDLLKEQEEKDEQYQRKLVPAGFDIHQLLQDSFKTLELSAASPAWQLYTAQMDAMVLMSLKASILTSLDAMYTTIACMEGTDTTQILEVRLELVEQTVSFSPPLDRSVSVDNVEDAVSAWLASFLKRSTLIKRLADPSSSYEDFLANDSDVWEVVQEIRDLVQENAIECKKHLSLFDDYKFLWVQDVQQSFIDFLNGRPSPNPLRSQKKSTAMSRTTNNTTGQRSRISLQSPDAINEAERAFLTSHSNRLNIAGNRGNLRSSEDIMVAPGLADFDDEIGIYRLARDSIRDLPDLQPVGWILFNFQPIKQVLTTYASKWMWTFMKYLSDQVTGSLDTLADFLARTEPEIESITGEERDTASFMKMMRLFNEVSAQQQDMDGRFAVMQRTVNLLEKYDMRLPSDTQEMFRSAPDRWNHLKTKVSLAKQRLGPRIQEESDRITRDLLRFSERVESLGSEIRSSDVFLRDCPIYTANETIDDFVGRLRLLQTEAQDLIELQELLETAVVNFGVLPQHQRDLKNLKVVWQHVKMVQDEQRDWKVKQWQRIDTKHLHNAIAKQKDMLRSLPAEVTDWDVYTGMIASVHIIEQCLPLVEDLNHPAMRTRHWKQLVRITGGLMQTDTDSLKRMVLGDLLELGLQKHADEVKAIVQRAVKDLTIESSLKTCEEVWLSKVFELKPHTRGQSKAVGPDFEAGSEMTGSELMPQALLQTYEGSRTGGTRTKSMKSGIHSRSSDKTGGSVSKGKGGGRTSVLSLPVSLLNLVDDPSPIFLLKNIDKILSDLQHHQMELTRMQCNSAIGSFLDEVTKWQKRLHLIEAVLDAWVTVQIKWVQLDEVYSGADVRTALAHEANMFAVMSKDFRLLMRATEKNTNVLQSCSRKGLLPMLEKMDTKLEQCRHALLGNLERRRQRFPRFYFLSPEDVMNIVCYGYDLDAVNKFLIKILPHMGRLLFDEEQSSNQNLSAARHASAGLKKKYKVKGVESTCGEVMPLCRPLIYEGPMSLWLPQLLASIQATLQEQLHVALGNEPRPANVEQSLRSAGASKVRISRPSSAVSQRSGGSQENPKISVTPPQTDTDSARDPIQNEKVSEMTDILSCALSGSLPKQQVSWTLDNSTQVVILSTMVQMNDRLHEALRATSSGDQAALNKVADVISDSLHASVIMLKGIEDERAVRLRSARRRMKKRDNKVERDDESEQSESIGVPSTRLSLDDEFYGDDNYNDDVMVQTDSGQAPMETMQSLLAFTGHVPSGSQGTRGDLDQLEQNTAESGDVATSSDGKLLLFPSQIQKINSLISILTQQRDTCHMLRDVIKEGAKSKPKHLFEWAARLRHVYDKEDMRINVHALSWQFEYGYEYQGSCTRHVVSPCHDRVMLSMCQALKSHMGVALQSDNFNILGELAHQMGRALYSVLATPSLDHYMLGDLFKGVAETGCWVCFHHVDALKPSVLSVAGQLAAEVHQALMSGRPAITLMSEEVSLSPHAASFVTFNSAARGSHEASPLNKIIPTIGANMPKEFAENFRVINLIKPDRRAILEIQLLAQGFTQAEQMASKLCVFLDLAGTLLSTVPCTDTNEMTSATTRGIAPHIAYRDNPSSSLPLIECVISCSGVILDSLLREQLELKQEYRETMTAKTRKFASVWRHRSSIMSSSGGLASSFNDDSGGEGPPGVLSSSSIAPSIDPETQEVILVNKDREAIESDVEMMRKMEEVAIATGLRDVLLPRLTDEEERSLVATFVVDLWPDAEVDFGLEEDEDVNAEVTLSTRPLDSDFTPNPAAKSADREPTNEDHARVTSAIAECKLSLSSGFQTKVTQLSELIASMRSVIVHGSAGCGKSKVIEAYAQTRKQQGYNVITKRVYVNAVDSRDKLFGYFEPDSREWRDGLLQGLLRPHCLELDAPNSTQHPSRREMFLLHVDGRMQHTDTDIFIQLLQTSYSIPSWFILANNERICIPLDVGVVWELEDLSSLTPAVVSKLALLGFTGSEVTWGLHLDHWLDGLASSTRSACREITTKYLPPLLQYVTDSTTPPHLATSRKEVTVRLRQMTRVTAETMTSTFCKLVDCLVPPQGDSSYAELEIYIGYSAFWAFGGTLDADSREVFGTWWCERFPHFFSPGDPWHQFVDGETRTLVQWEDHLPQFSGIGDSGGAFVHTPEACQLIHLIGALMDAGNPSMLVGPLGCGKSAILRERVNNVSSGEVAEVLSLFVHCNRLTEASNLWSRVSENLEWKHGVTYTPRGNKKLLCMIDDLNLSRILGKDEEWSGLQSACELIRQHLDVGGVRNPSSYKWQQVSNTIYATTINPQPSSKSCPLGERVTRHFSIFASPYPLVQTQFAIFSAMLHNHFLPNFGGTSGNLNPAEIENERQLETLLSHVVLITVGLQERLRNMYLSTPERAHYNFALGDLERIFRNLMLSLGPDCHQRELLLLWRHECEWAYGRRMISTVDKERYHQALNTSVRKYLTESKHLPVVLATEQPLFSSVRELDSGLVTAGRHMGRNTPSVPRDGSGSTPSSDHYKPVTNPNTVHDLLLEALKEYNKVNVQMKLSLYEATVVLVCRLARLLQSPHRLSHGLLFGDGCPALAALVVNLAGHLGGFRVNALPPIITPPSTDSSTPTGSVPGSIPESDKEKLCHFKRHVVQLYNLAGVKGEKIVFLLHDDSSLTDECLAMIEEMVRHGAIPHLFTPDEQTTISNAVRSDVTAAGLTYSKDVAWSFFLSTVTKNLRVVLVCSRIGQPFMAKSLEFPSLFSRFNTVVLPHWSHEELVGNALYHFHRNHVINNDADVIGRRGGRGRWMMNRRRQENVAHLLANIHSAIKEKDKDKFYKVPGHISNYAYEKLVERFLYVYNERRQVVNKSHEATRSARENIDRENEIAKDLQQELDREKQVLEEHKTGTLQLLAQIGQDMVITEQQVSAVRRQVKNIHHLKKNLPEYQLAHEKAVFKAAAIVADTKKVVSDIAIHDLSELRSLQKPDPEVEDLMAAIIMILKSPNSDVTWSKGAKRQMANLDRFLDELSSFDEIAMPLNTLETLESFCEKETFTPDSVTAKAGGNTAAGSLLRWVQGVLRYHTTMITRVKPLHTKVEETSSSIGDAQHKLRQLQSKKEALEARLRDLATGFEQATADKNWQEEKRREMQEHLRVAAQFREVLAGEHRRCSAVLNSYEDRLEWVVGASAIAAAFATYLGPYPSLFRRMMLTIDWAQCLVEKGIPLVFDSTDPVKGHVIEFMLDINENVHDTSPHKVKEGDTTLDAVIKAGAVGMEEEGEEPKGDRSEEAPSEGQPEEPLEPPLSHRDLPPVTEETDADDEDDDVTAEARTQPEVETTIVSQSVGFHPYTVTTLPFLSNDEYLNLVTSLMKILTGEITLQEWITKDFAHHQLQNAAIMLSSWQRPPLLLDPYLSGVDWCAIHLRHNANTTPVNLGAKIETSHVTTIEKAILGGHTLMLMDCENQAGALLRPLIHHSNTSGWLRTKFSDETQTVRLLGRRLVSPESFRLYLTTTKTSAAQFHPDIIAGTQLLSYVPSVETLQEDLLIRALQRVRPEVYHGRRRVARIVRQHRHTLAQLDSILCERLVTGNDPKSVENSTKFLSNVVELKATISTKLSEAEEVLTSLNQLREELFPVAQRGALLYSICRALPVLNIHYQIPLPFFLHLFDSSVGSETDDDERDPRIIQDVEIIHPTDAEEEEKRALHKRKASLRLGSAKRSLKKLVSELPPTAEDEAASTPPPTDTTDSDPAIDDDEGSEAGSHVIVPEVGDLPSLEHDGLSNEKVQEIVDDLTRRVFASVYSSLYPHHRLQVTALALLSMQSEESEMPYTDEELALMVHGNPGFGRQIPFTLEDFDCSAPVPPWIPADRWEDLMAFSILPGTLEGICAQVAQSSDPWKSWYESEEPEKVDFPEPPDEASTLSDMQRLLLVRTLRPDRYDPALRIYVEKNINGSVIGEITSRPSCTDAETLFKDVSNTLGILVLLPTNVDDVMARVAMQPTDVIKRLADKYKVAVETVTLGKGYHQEASRCIDTANTQDSWALINGLHLAPDNFFEVLRMQLARMGNISRHDVTSSNDESVEAHVTSQGSHFQVWMTSLPHDALPSTLTQYLYKISWDSLMRLVAEDRSLSIPPYRCATFKACLTSTMSKLSSHVVSQWQSCDNRSLLYVTCVMHAVMLSRHCYGWHGNKKWYTIHEATLDHALQYAANGDKVRVSLLQNIYKDAIEDEMDRIYFDNLFNELLRQSKESEITLNGVKIPVPPTSVSPSDMPSWLNDHLPDDLDSTSALSVPSTSLSWHTTQDGAIVLEDMQNLFNAVQQPGYESSYLSPGSKPDVIKHPLTLSSLQGVLDVCSEQLPPLLDLGRAQGGRMKSFDFPYHRPSLMSSVEPDAVHMPESIGFVLLQECMWFNNILCFIRQQLHELRSFLFATSDYQLTNTLRDTAASLTMEEVPRTWQHQHETPNSHVLLTWLDDVKKRHEQLRSWVRSGMVPQEGKTPVGNLASVWLGGMCNPGAILLALCQEKAVLHDVSLDQVRMRCVIVPESGDVMEREAGMFVEDVHVINAKLGADGVLHSHNGNDVITALYFYPSLLKDDESTSDEGLIEFPVYVNVSCQHLVGYLPLPSRDITRYVRPLNELPVATDAYVILQSGPDLTKRDAFKSRAYLAQKRRDDWSRVSPAVSEMMSRSGTRMSSRMSGPRVSVSSIPLGSQKAPSITKTNSPVPGFGSQDRLSVGFQPAPSEKSLSSEQLSEQQGPPVQQEPIETSQTQQLRIPNGDVPHGKVPHLKIAPPSGDNQQIDQPLGGSNSSRSGESTERQDKEQLEVGILQTLLDDESEDYKSTSSMHTSTQREDVTQ